jgi:hypothetical protein
MLSPLPWGENLITGAARSGGIMGRKFGFSFSWKRALGLSAAKARLSRKIGIPLTRSGRQRMMGRALGCSLPLALGLILGLTALGWAAGLLKF